MDFAVVHDEKDSVQGDQKDLRMGKKIRVGKISILLEDTAISFFFLNKNYSV